MIPKRMLRHARGACFAGAFYALSLVNASGAIVAVGSLGALNAGDQVDWGNSGAEFAVLGSTFSALTNGGLGVEVSGSTFGFERVDQSSSWLGNFAPGAKLLWTGFGFAETLNLVFDADVYGAGAQIQSDFYGNFAGTISAFDSTNLLLFSHSFSGSSTTAANNSAIFVGLVDTTPTIRRIQFELESGEAFAVGSLAVNRTNTQSVPDSSQYVTGTAALALFLAALLRSRSSRLASRFRNS